MAEELPEYCPDAVPQSVGVVPAFESDKDLAVAGPLRDILHKSGKSTETFPGHVHPSERVLHERIETGGYKDKFRHILERDGFEDFSIH